MKKSAKLSLTLALMMGITGGVQLMNTNTASAEISDNFRLRLEGVMSYYHDPDYNYYNNSSKNAMNGWNHYTRLYFTYNVDRNTTAYARVHSGYDQYADHYKYDNNYTYFDQAYFTFKDKVSSTTYLLGKRGMTLGQSMVYNATGNQTGVQIDLGNWYDPNNVKFFWGDRKGGQRVLGAQAAFTPLKNIQFTATQLYHEDNTRKGGKDNVTDFGVKAKAKAFTLVGEYAYNHTSNPAYHSAYSTAAQKATLSKDSSQRKAWFVELYTGPTNDFGSGLPLQKVGTHAFSIRYQDVAPAGTVVHNNTFYDNRKGVRLDYGYVFKKGMSADICYGRMKDKGMGKYTEGKGHMSNIVVASISYKFK